MSIKHLVVHKGSGYHSAFPSSIIRLQNGDLVTVFREAPVRPAVDDQPGTKLAHQHRDPQSRISLVRSIDDGRTWDPGSRVVIDESDGTVDLNMAVVGQAASGDLVVNNFRCFLDQSNEQVAALSAERFMEPRPASRPFGGVVFDSLYLFRSTDDGRTWSKPEPASIPSLAYRSHTGTSGIVEMPDSSYLLPLNGCCPGDVGEGRAPIPDRAFVVRSRDGGRTWGQPSAVAHDPHGRLIFGEPSLLRLPSGKLLCMMRTGDYLYQAFSTDDGWVWQGLRRSPIWGFPSHLLRLRSGRILCTYGYRREPFGIRACLSDDEGETWDVSNEIVIRDDGVHRDLGYPSSVQLQDGRILSVYYFHGEDDVRYIAGSIYTEDHV